MSESVLTQAGQVNDDDFRYEEEWEVYVSNQREPYLLNEMEYAVFRDALLKGIKGVIHFERLGINTSFYVSSYRKSRRLKKEYQLKAPEPEPYVEPTPEQKERTRKLIEELRKKLGVKFSKQI